MSALKSVDLPTLGSPTMPMERDTATPYGTSTPAAAARARRSDSGRAPVWEMTSAAQIPPSRALSHGVHAVRQPVEHARGEEIPGAGGVDHPLDRRRRHLLGAVRGQHDACPRRPGS